MEMIESKDWRGIDMTLVYKGTNKAVLKGDVIDGETIRGGRAPHKPSSDGKLWGDFLGERYTRCMGCEWVES